MSFTCESEYELLHAISTVLQESLDVQHGLARASPLLQELLHADHIALASSRTAAPTEYEWQYTTLPARYVASYARVADRDFIRIATAPSPNRVLSDEEMITRKEYERHILYRHARDSGATLENVLAVMLPWDPGANVVLSCFRTRLLPFTPREKQLLQLLVPHLGELLRRTREGRCAQRQAWLEDLLGCAEIAVIWTTPEAVEVDRTPAATALLLQHFPSPAQGAGALPAMLRSYLLECVATSTLAARTPPLVVEHGLSCLHVSALRRPEADTWALVLKRSGIPAPLAARLSPRLTQIAVALLKGLSHEEIAARDERSLATIKQQSMEVYGRLGVSGRRGLSRLAVGFVAD